MIEVVRVPGIAQYEEFGFTNCVRYRDVLYLSGFAALDEQGNVEGKNIVAQTIKTYENIEAALKAAGSGLDHILQMTSFVVDLERHGRGYVDTRQKILTKPNYTSATIGVVSLMLPELLVEVQCCAAVPSA